MRPLDATAQPNLLHLILLLAALLLSPACTGVLEDNGSADDSEFALTTTQRKARYEAIKNAAYHAGMSRPVLLAGIAQAETGLAHCWSEATWACKGPASSSCGGGPVIAGAGDGPCYLKEGGLGMFQFDAGTFDDTLRREGNGVLTLEGNTQAGVRFVTSMVVRSQYVPGVSTEGEALAWLNSVSVDDILNRTAKHEAWIKTVVHYYNGCVPGRCSVYNQRTRHYTDSLDHVLREGGVEFWRLPLSPTDNTPGDSTGGDTTHATPPASVPVTRDFTTPKYPRALSVNWSRHEDGSYSFFAGFEPGVERVEFFVDGFRLGEATLDEESDLYLIYYTFSQTGLSRLVEAVGYDANGDPVAGGAGLLDVGDDAAMDIRQQDEETYLFSLSGAPSNVAKVKLFVSPVDLLGGESLGYLVSDAVDARDAHHVTAIIPNTGKRLVTMVSYDQGGAEISRTQRVFHFR